MTQAVLNCPQNVLKLYKLSSGWPQTDFKQQTVRITNLCPILGDDPSFKLVMVGDSGVGKSCLLEKFLNLSSNNAFISTIGVDIKTHVLKLDGQAIKLQV